MQEMSRNKCHMIRPFFFVKTDFLFFGSHNSYSKEVLSLMCECSKKLVQVFLVLWHDGFWEASTEGGYETTTTESFDGSNKTEVVGGRFFEAAAAVKACENLLGFGLGGLRRQTRVKQN